jgi:signal transduction histidine kinase
MQMNMPDHLRVMRTAAWMWILYLVALTLVDLAIYASRPVTQIFWYHFFNAFPALLFLGLAYSEWLENRAKILTPLMILLISVVPVLINHMFDLRLPPAPLANLEGMVLRQLPVLFIGLVLVAWHYRLISMILYSISTNLLELSIVFALSRLDDPSLNVFTFITIIRTVCFILVGIFINQLINDLRTQQESLKAANNQLTHYAGTLETLAISRERNRMSRELHDTVVHTLSGLAVQLETAKAYGRVDPETTEKLVEQSLAATRNGLQETRRALKALRASPLEDLGLVIAMQKVIETAAQRGKLLLDVQLPQSSFTLNPDVEQCIYRVTQEAVENVVHHANAQHLTVKLAVHASDIELWVKDDGIGFHPEASLSPGHFGLAGMRERAQWVGGGLTITSAEGKGTLIHLAIVGCVQ